MEDKKRKDVDLDEVEELDEDLDLDEIEDIDDEELEDKKHHDDEEDIDDEDIDDFDDIDDEDIDDDIEDEDDDVEDKKSKDSKKEVASSEKDTKKSKKDDKDELLEDEGESFGAKIVIAIVIIAIIIILLLKACGGKKEQFKVTFDTNGGTTVEALMVDKNGTIKKPANPTKEGYTFAGWYYNGKLYDFNTKVTGNIKLEAHWNEEGGDKVTGVTLNETAISLQPGGTATLVATVKPASAKDKSLTWSSSDESIVTVDENGNVKALKVGKATITVTTKDGGYSATVTVTVTNDAIPVTGISFADKTLNLATNSSITLKPTFSPSDATDKRLTWKTSDPNIATVDQNGKVTGKKDGTVTITATTVDGGHTATITIVVKHEPVTGVKITGNNSVNVGKSITLKATITPNNASNKAVTWKSSDTSIATVDQNGKVTGKKAGQVTITVTTKDGNKTATFKVTVKDPKVTKITISGANKVTEGQSIRLTANVAPNDATNKKVKWSSSDTSIATVDQNGNVKGVKAGKVIITAEATDGSGVKATYEVTVNKKEVTYVLTLTPMKDGMGDFLQYRYAITADNKNLPNSEIKGFVYNGKSTAAGNYVDKGNVNTSVKTAQITLKNGDKVTATVVVEK